MPGKNPICWSAFYTSLRWVCLNLTNIELICTNPVKEVYWGTGFVFTGGQLRLGQAAASAAWAKAGPGQRRRRMKDAPELQQPEDGGIKSRYLSQRHTGCL